MHLGQGALHVAGALGMAAAGRWCMAVHATLIEGGILCTHACNIIILTISHTLIGVKYHPEYLNLTHSWPHLYLYRSHDGDSARDTQNEMHLKRRFLDTGVERRVNVK